MDLYTVIGNPIAHSRSPELHDAFARQCGVAMQYTRTLAPLEGFEQTLQTFAAQGGRGANITLPFKTQAYALAQAHTSAAKAAGAANTLAWQGDHWLADNTDGVGLVRALPMLAGKNILLLGAGGAAAGAIPALLEQNPAGVWLYNRTAQRAQTLAARFDGIEPCLPSKPVDIVINATSASVNGQVPSIPATFLEGAFCYDMFYDLNAPTAFVRWAIAVGAAQAEDGWSMLVEQAAAAFALWHAQWPQTKALIAQR